MLEQDHRAFDRARSGESPFLSIPPFPGSKVSAFEFVDGPDVAIDSLIEAMKRERVGGTFWGLQPDLPESCLLARSPDALAAAQLVEPGVEAFLWEGDGDDPWHMLAGAKSLFVDAGGGDVMIRLIASLLGVPVYQIAGEEAGEPQRAQPAELLASLLPGRGGAVCPFSGMLLTLVEAVELCGFWRRLIDSNRDIGGGLGFAFWKRDNVAPLLWSGGEPFKFLSGARDVPGGQSAAVWRTRTPQPVIDELASANVPMIEVEDGFLRSRGLGADCVPPLSITVDRLGAYFDPGQASELEDLLQYHVFTPELLDRAAALRKRIVESGLGKYDAGGGSCSRFGGERRHILVPGQVEDDRSIQTGGAGLSSNLELLARVRARAPDAFIVYKPHPDVVAGHRKGAVDEREALRNADRVITSGSVSTLLDVVDEVHVNTSLTGFEALLRRKSVTTHGVPFYAGWGLTEDLGPVPERRTRRLSIDELTAATLLLYPRYLDPVTGLPCPAEVVVSRLVEQAPADGGMIIALRRLQGRLMRRLRRIGS